jgi:uncharacterized protein
MTESARGDDAIVLGAAPRRLEGRLALPAGAVRGGAVVCHPHPQYGGDMDNAVVQAIAGALVNAGWAALRFNFGGVGRSEGVYGGGPAEVSDAARAAAGLVARLPAGVPLALVGYSFGAWVALQLAARADPRVACAVGVGPPLAFFAWEFVGDIAPPVTLVVGDRDQYCPPARLTAVRTRGRTPVTVVPVPGADHFLVGDETRVADAVCAACAPHGMRG